MSATGRECSRRNIVHLHNCLTNYVTKCTCILLLLWDESASTDWLFLVVYVLFFSLFCSHCSR